MEHRRGDYTISTDRAKLDLEFIHRFLSQSSYWAEGRSLAVVRRSIEHSLCIGVYGDEQQVGLARVVTDYATYAWLCDVFVAEPHRGQGLGKWLIETVVSLPELEGLRLFMLATRDAHGLYREYGGFLPVDKPEKFMLRRGPEQR